MQQNEELIADQNIINQLNIHFTLLRRETGKCSVPSKIDDEIHTIIIFALKTPNPIIFLQKNGLIFFDKCCGINLSLLAKKVLSCRSRVSECFRREGWATSFSNEKSYKQQLKDILSFNQSKFWSLRQYPLDSKVFRSTVQYPQIISQKIEPTQPEKKIEDTTFELTLQKDIFSWTCFDDL